MMRNKYSSTPNSIWILITINAILWVATLFARRFIFDILGLQPATFPLQPWTICTAMFVHAGLWHLLANMFTFYFFGTFIARLVGEGRLLLV